VKQLSISQLKSEAGESPITAQIDAQIQSLVTKTTKNGKPYLEVTLSDAGGSFTLKIWENLPQYHLLSAMETDACVRVFGDWAQNQYGIEGLRWDLRPLSKDEINQLFSGDPALKDIQDADWEFIMTKVSYIADPRLHHICKLFLTKHGTTFRRTAAARKNHHARRGGLVEHVAQMMRAAHAICSVYTDLNRDLLTAGILFHDCGKMWENTYPEQGYAQPFMLEGELLGHIPIGLNLTTQLWEEMELSPEADTWQRLEPSNDQVKLHLLHLIASHHGTYEFGSPTLPRTPEAFALHHIDNLDAKYEMFRMAYANGNQLADNIIERSFPLPSNIVTPLPSFAVKTPPQPETKNTEVSQNPTLTGNPLVTPGAPVSEKPPAVEPETAEPPYTDQPEQELTPTISEEDIEAKPFNGELF